MTEMRPSVKKNGSSVVAGEEDDELKSSGRFMFRMALALTLGYIALGAIVYSVFADMTWNNALYFVVVTLTTVGYGDHCR